MTKPLRIRHMAHVVGGDDGAASTFVIVADPEPGGFQRGVGQEFRFALDEAVLFQHARETIDVFWEVMESDEGSAT